MLGWSRPTVPQVGEMPLRVLGRTTMVVVDHRDGKGQVRRMIDVYRLQIGVTRTWCPSTGSAPESWSPVQTPAVAAAAV